MRKKSKKNVQRRVYSRSENHTYGFLFVLQVTSDGYHAHKNQTRCTDISSPSARSPQAQFAFIICFELSRTAAQDRPFLPERFDHYVVGC